MTAGIETAAAASGLAPDCLSDARWDAMAAKAGFYVSRPWLMSFAADGFPAPRLVLTDDGTAAMPVYEFSGAPWNSRYDLVRFAAPGQEDRWRPQALLGGVAGYGNGLLLAPGLDAAGREAAVGPLASLLDAMTAHCGAAASAFLSADDAALLLPYLTGWVPVFADAEAVLPVSEAGFDAWVRSLPASRRSVVQRDLASGGGRAETADVHSAPSGTVELIAQVQARHGEAADLRGLADFVKRCVWSADCGVPTPMFSVFGDDGTLRAVSIAFAWGGTLYLRAVGLDYGLVAGSSDYFRVLIYEPLRYACEHGLRRIHLGIGGMRTKLLRGAQAEPLWTLVRPPAGVEAADLRQRGWQVLQSLRDELGRLLVTEPAAAWEIGQAGEGTVVSDV